MNMKVKLGDIAILINGDRGKNYPSQADIVLDGDVPFVNAGHLNGRNINFSEMNYISKEKYVQLNSGKFREGDILYCLRGSLGKKAVVNSSIEGAIASSLVIIRPDSTRVDVNYLMFALDSSSIQEQLIKANNGSSQPNLSAASVRGYEVDLPDKKVQEDIVDKLSKVRAIIDARQQELQKLDQLIKARFVELFGDPFDTTKWPVKELKDISESMLDGSNVNPDYYESEGEVLFLRIQNVWRNEFRLDDSVYISQEVSRNHYYDTSLKAGDLLITKIGRYYTKDSSLGRVSLYRGKDDCANYSNNIMRVRLNDLVNSEFVNALLNLDDYQSYIRRTSKGGTDKRALSKSLIGSYPIIIPPRSLQNEFVSFVEQVDKSKVKEIKKNYEPIDNGFYYKNIWKGL